jgi:AraC family transcriptional regulator of adaptative response / DNA-3-methyladenine glycosylase II
MSFQPIATNRMTSLPGFTATYDADGNVLNDGSHAYTWDAYGKYNSVDGSSVVCAPTNYLRPKTSSFLRKISYHPLTNAMELDHQVCSRARLARDARFDGKFFIGVLTTRIYCRPICRARTSKECNVRYFPSAAAAGEAGFRPCLRCRPECSPGTPAWIGTRNTVSRALQLISEGGLEDGGVEALSERLGIGSRHLRRLFLRHLGATPSAVAQTGRLHFAKKLIDETNLPMMQVALSSGFGCVRRFNEAIRSVYHRTPTQIRALAPRAPDQPQNQYLFHLHYRPPYNWKRVLQFLAARIAPGIESVDSNSYRRTFSVNGTAGDFSVSHEPEKNTLAVLVQFADPRSLFFIIERIRAMFDLNADWATIAKTLCSDPALSRLAEAEEGLRVPGCWSAFELTTRAILEQHVTVDRAAALTSQLVKTFGQPFFADARLTHLFPTPESLNLDLTNSGIPSAKANTINAFARAVCEGKIKFEGIPDSDAFLRQLCELPGIETTAAQYVAMRALRDPDAFPAADPVLRRIAGARTARELERRSEHWRPWRAYAANLLWQSASKIPAPRPAQQSRPTSIRESHSARVDREPAAQVGSR